MLIRYSAHEASPVETIEKFLECVEADADKRATRTVVTQDRNT
jgi:hypothetical protein